MRVARAPTSAGSAFAGGGLRRREEREAELVGRAGARARPGRSAPGSGCARRSPTRCRLCFERDLDRVKHSRPWRRLAGKCQVFIAPEDDHLRTRLTHAVEVAQVATGIARAANLCLPLDRGDRARPRLRPRPRRARVRGGVLAVPPGTAATTTRSTAPTSRSRRSTCAVETLDGVRNHSWRRPAAVDARGRGGGLGRPHRVRLPRLRRRGAGRDPRARRPARRGARRRRAPRPSEQIGTFVRAVLDAIDRTGARRDDRARGVRAGRRSGPSTSSGSTCAPRRAARPTQVVRLLGGLVDHFADAPRRIPDGARRRGAGARRRARPKRPRSRCTT